MHAAKLAPHARLPTHATVVPTHPPPHATAAPAPPPAHTGAPKHAVVRLVFAEARFVSTGPPTPALLTAPVGLPTHVPPSCAY